MDEEELFQDGYFVMLSEEADLSLGAREHFLKIQFDAEKLNYDASTITEILESGKIMLPEYKLSPAEGYRGEIDRLQCKRKCSRQEAVDAFVQWMNNNREGVAVSCISAQVLHVDLTDLY